jgi:Cu(I)/Ag(I) efflux system membrane fusion protein/cobalt-zinc-cadmium efflux system membrane fusion protein
MTDKKNDKKGLRAVILLLAAVAAGVLLAQLLPPDLFGLRATAIPRAAASSASELDAETDGQLWTCGMHPHVLEHGPGPCPICGMNMVPLRGSGDDGDDHAGSAQQWICPDHPSIVMDEPGECPIDGLELVPVPTSVRSASAERKLLFYRNPMDPTITSPVPAKDSMGMDYVPVYDDAAGSAGSTEDGSTVRIDPAVVQNMNVRTEIVEVRDLTQPIRTVGYLEYDQQRMVTVTTKYSGWVEKVYVNYVGEKVRRGQPLFEVYSPELVQTEQELLSALDFAGQLAGAPEDARKRAESLVESARTRLGYWDISPQQIAFLEETGEVFRTLKVAAPSNGLVMKRMAGLEGMAVKPGMEIFHIADLSSLWISVELFEHQVAWVREGTPAQIALSYFPGEPFHGKVRFLEPELSEKTRTMRAKIEVPNPGGRLRKGMYATVEFQPVIVHDAVAVPQQAVLRTGLRNVVIVAIGEGRFSPREVTLGHEAEGYAQVLSGLEAGAEVVTSAQFLLDSESKLREAIQKMIANRETDGSMGDTMDGSVDHSGHL